MGVEEEVKKEAFYIEALPSTLEIHVLVSSPPFSTGWYVSKDESLTIVTFIRLQFIILGFEVVKAYNPSRKVCLLESAFFKP